MVFLKIVFHAATPRIDWLARGKLGWHRCDWVEGVAYRPMKRGWWYLGGYVALRP